MPPAYICLCRGLEYILKFKFYSRLFQRLMFMLTSDSESATLPYIWKKSQKWTVFVLSASNFHIMCSMFIKISQNVCLINKHILMHWYARSDCKLWTPFDFVAFFKNFVLSIVSSPNFPRLYVWSMYTL